MSTLIERVETAVNTMEAVASNAPSHIQKMQAHEDNVTQAAEANLTALADLRLYTLATWVSGQTYPDRRVFFDDGGTKYIPVLDGYVAGASIAADFAAGTLIVQQGLTQSDMASDAEASNAVPGKIPDAKQVADLIDLLAQVVSGKAAASHTHSNYASTSHTHSGFASTSHTHSGYAADDHSHSNLEGDIEDIQLALLGSTIWSGSGSTEVTWSDINAATGFLPAYGRYYLESEYDSNDESCSVFVADFTIDAVGAVGWAFNGASSILSQKFSSTQRITKIKFYPAFPFPT